MPVARVQAITSMFVGYRDFLTVTRLAGRSHYASENADRMIINVVDVNLPTIDTPGHSPLHPAKTSPSLGPCIFRVEFDRAGASARRILHVAALRGSLPLLPSCVGVSLL
jgi:hypothetical protein